LIAVNWLGYFPELQASSQMEQWEMPVKMVSKIGFLVMDRATHLSNDQ
jgi:hypothetical protein